MDELSVETVNSDGVCRMFPLNDISYVPLIVACTVKRPVGEVSCFCKQLCSVCPVMRRAHSGKY